MKRIVLSTLTICTGLLVNAQSLSILDPVQIVNGTVAELGTNGELVADWDVQNISENFIEVRAARNVISAVEGSSNYFCWGVCFGAETNISPISTNQDMNPGDVNTTFYAHYISGGTAGVTEIEYCFFNAANPSDRACQTVQYCVDAECIVSVENPTTEFELGDISPNPLSGLGSIKYSFLNNPASDSKIVIYNMIGQTIKEIKVNGKEGIILVNAQDFENGIYFYSLISNGKTQVTKRMLISK